VIKLLYIDNRKYGHNRDIHVDFIDSLNKNKIFTVVGFGSGLYNLSFKYYKPNNSNINNHFFNIIKKEKPDAILTYNRNGSSYTSGGDNISLYNWIADALKKVDLPKFHITTDYCRSGFRQEQADWFKNLGFSASIFRQKVALDYPIDIDSYWLPFSVDSSLYNKYSIKNFNIKSKKVGFIGSAGDISKNLYRNRIAAMDFLSKKNLLKTTRVVGNNFKRKMLFGKDYINFISSQRFGLTCGGTCNFLTAKYFQIPAAKSMLICSDTIGLEIFPEDLYIKYSADNLEEMIDSIEYYNNNNNEKEYRERTLSLNSFVIKNHNNKKRGIELLSIIKRYL